VTEHWALTASASEVDATERAALAQRLSEWLTSGGEGVLLLTCHRAELYGVGPLPGTASVARVLRGEGATNHLLRVACGLESAIVGEDEVLNQVRQALQAAVASRRVDRRLHRLFETAIATGRRARSGRTASSGGLAQNAVRWLTAKTQVSGRMTVVGGAGRMGATLAHSLARAGAQVVVASRDANRAARLARLYDARGVDLRTGAELVGEAAGVAVALGGPWHELQATDAASLPPIADISAPQAVPDSVRGRLNGNFLGIDDLYRQTQPLPGAYIKDAEGLVAARSAEYAAWLDRAR
jgi:glutamyl-tRNA reductase